MMDHEGVRSCLGVDDTVATKHLSQRASRAEVRMRSLASVGIPCDRKVLCRRRLRGLAGVGPEQTAQRLLAAYVESLVRETADLTKCSRTDGLAVRYPVANSLVRTVAVEEAAIVRRGPAAGCPGRRARDDPDTLR